MEGIWPPNLGGMGGKVETLTPHISKTGGPGRLEIFCAVGGLRALKNKILASGPPVKGAQKRIISISKNFSETSHQILTKFSAFWGVIPMIPSAKYGGNLTTEFWGRGLKLTPLNNARR